MNNVIRFPKSPIKCTDDMTARELVISLIADLEQMKREGMWNSVRFQTHFMLCAILKRMDREGNRYGAY